MKSVQTSAEVCSLVREAAQRDQPIYPVGGQTQQHRLAPMRDEGVRIDLRGLNRLVDHPYEDMTITVEAGMTLNTLEQLLNAKQQTLPIDVPRSHEATAGGSIAANINGPRRTGWGTWRDYLIGIHWINDQGEEAKAGGRVVKNVAGYDFCKLMTGSHGALGIITQITLKVKPQPAACRLLQSTIRDENIGKFVEYMKMSRLRPTLYLVQPTQTALWDVYLGFEGSHVAVDWQIQQLREISSAYCTWHACHESSTERVGKVIYEQLANYELENSFLTFQACMRSSRTLEFVYRIANHPKIKLQVQPDAGLILGHVTSSLEQKEIRQLMSAMRASTGRDGHVSILRCPAEWRQELQPFGQKHAGWDLMRKVKQAMDPRNLFQRGRHEIMEDISAGGKHG